jgi:hypothetical protein
MNERVDSTEKAPPIPVDEVVLHLLKAQFVMVRTADVFPLI